MAQVKRYSARMMGGFPLNCIYVRGERGSVLVDTGTSRNAKRILDWFRKEGIDPKELKAIFLTHVHMDHVGGVSQISKSVDGVSVAVHREGVEHLQEGTTSSIRPPGFVGWMIKPFASLGSRFPPYKPDIVIDQEMDLNQWGIEGGRVVFTPGHTPESISLIVPEDENWIAVVGDLFMGNTLRPKKPREHFLLHDRSKARESIRRLLQWQPPIQTFYTGHYGPFSREALLQGFEGFL